MLFRSNSNGCDSVATLNVTISAVSTSTTNVTVCNTQLPYSWNGTNYNAPGTYTYTTIGSTGCDSIATLNLTVNNATTSTTSVTICNTQLPYSWNGNNYNTAGTYSVTFTASNGCDSIASLNLSVTSLITPQFNGYGPYCLNAPIKIGRAHV